ncbi:hypothetical protein AKJ16_DCAP00715 [Drosera capensis]
MNRSFRGQESLMPSIRPKVPAVAAKSVKVASGKEREEELALFLEMRKREKERNELLLNSSDGLDDSFGLQQGSAPIFNIPSVASTRRAGSDDFLNSNNDKNDYDW